MTWPSKFFYSAMVACISLPSTSALCQKTPDSPIVADPPNAADLPAFEQGMCFFGPARTVKLSDLSNERFFYYRIPIKNLISIQKDEIQISGSQKMGKLSLEEIMIGTLSAAPSAEPSPVFIVTKGDGLKGAIFLLPLTLNDDKKRGKRVAVLLPSWPMQPTAKADGVEIAACMANLK